MAYTGFQKLQGQLAQRPGVTNPAALAAVIGRNKYGGKAMAHGAATGHSLKGRPQLREQLMAHRARKKKHAAPPQQQQPPQMPPGAGY